MYTNMAFGAAKAVLFIEVSSLQGVLIRGVPLYMYFGYYFKCGICIEIEVVHSGHKNWCGCMLPSDHANNQTHCPQCFRT